MGKRTCAEFRQLRAGELKEWMKWPKSQGERRVERWEGRATENIVMWLLKGHLKHGG